MMENSWYLTDRENNALATATKAAEPLASHVITAIHAAYSDLFSGTLVIKEGTTAKISVDFQGQISLGGMFVELTKGAAITVEVSASGEADVYGSFVIQGITK